MNKINVLKLIIHDSKIIKMLVVQVIFYYLILQFDRKLFNNKVIFTWLALLNCFFKPAKDILKCVNKQIKYSDVLTFANRKYSLRCAHKNCPMPIRTHFISNYVRFVPSYTLQYHTVRKQNWRSLNKLLFYCIFLFQRWKLLKLFYTVLLTQFVEFLKETNNNIDRTLANVKFS